MKNFNFEKKYVTNQLNIIKNIKIDPNNVVLNAAAFQDQLMRKYGLNLKKKKNPRFQIHSKNKNALPQAKNLIEKVNSAKETERDIIKRNKKFLSNLTFAEKTGIAKIERFPLSILEWRKLEEQTIKREDFKGECPICMEKLSSRESVILSCSHVFHKVCLKNFEKFAAVTKCPLCRCERYECKAYTKDKEYYVEKCVIIIQRFFRGFILRYHLYLTVFKNDMPKNKHLRSIYSYWKIKELTILMCNAIHKQTESNKKILEEIEKESKELIKIQNKNKALINETFKNGISDWDGAMDKASKRHNDICAICFCGFGTKELYILDCSHCFHKNCLDSFERFDPYFLKRCPICRANYKKRKVHDQKEIFIDNLKE